MHISNVLAICGIALTGLQITSALDADGWRNQSIYQLLTDRFARDDDLNAPCDLESRQYCGGTWRGISELAEGIQASAVLRLRCRLFSTVDKLDYIQVGDVSRCGADRMILTS